MAISPYDQETRQRAVRLYFEELADGASSKAAALRAVEAVIGIKTSTIRNWVRAEEKKADVAVEQSDAEKDAELITLRKENARLKEANEIGETGLSFFRPGLSSTAHGSDRGLPPHSPAPVFHLADVPRARASMNTLFHQQRSTASRPVVSGPPLPSWTRFTPRTGSLSCGGPIGGSTGDENYGKPPTGQAGTSAVTRCNAS